MDRKLLVKEGREKEEGNEWAIFGLILCCFVMKSPFVSLFPTVVPQQPEKRQRKGGH